MSRFLLTFLMLLACLAAPLRAVEEDLFVKRFGALPKDRVSMEFRQEAVRYGSMHLSALSMLGKSEAKDRKGFEEYRKTQVNPALDRLQPKTEEEKKMKAAAAAVIDAMAFWVDPALVAEDQRAATAGFLKACVLPGQEPSEFNELSGLVTRFIAYATGVSLEEFLKKLKEIREAERR